MQCPPLDNGTQEALTRLPGYLRPLATCNDIIGLPMPWITFVLAVFLIALALGLFFFHFFRPYWQLRAELKAADEFIDSKVPEKGVAIGNETYNEIDEYFSKQPNLSYAWSEFSESVRTHPVIF